MKLGFVPEQDRLPDSPDTIVTHEPTIGATLRSKGSLFLLVTGRVSGPRLREATELVAQSIDHDYFYDESAGIAVCLAKAIKAANKKIAQQRDRLGGDVASGPIGVAAAVVRGNELYVVTVGPAEAYLIRQARLATLPDVNREHGLPAAELEPDVWRGEISVGDSLLLASPGLVARLGTDAIKDALVTLHPQSAAEHLHHQFVAADGSGSDGAIALEATEVSATTKQRHLIPVKPPEPLAGTPDRSPIPLADGVSAGAAAVSQSASKAKTAAGGAAGRLFGGFLDRLPRRGVPHDRRVTSASSRQETQRRAAVAMLALVVVIASLGLGVWYLGGSGGSPSNLGSLNAGQKALRAAQTAIDQVYGPGVDLVKNDPPQAKELLTKAWQQLEAAAAGGIPASAIAPLRTKAQAGLDELYGLTPVGASTLFSFADAKTPADLGGVVYGPDRVPYVLDRATQAVYRVDTRTGKATPVARSGQAVSGVKIAEPRYIALAGPDVLILDSKNQLWRWRPAGSGKGSLAKVKVKGASSWGDDIRGLGAFVRNVDQGLYNLYVVDPSGKQILVYTPAFDGSGFPGDPSGWLAAPQDVSTVDTMLIDGDVYLSRDGGITRYARGGKTGWTPADPGDALLRPAPAYSVIASGTDKGLGSVYGYDRANSRVLKIDKDNGAIQAQYRLATGDPGWADLRGMIVVAGTGSEPDTLIWVDKGRVMSSLLEAIQGPTASPGASPSASSSASPAASPKPTKKPTKTPKP